MDNLNRDEVVALVGEESVAKAESLHCEPTCRLLPDWNVSSEYRASLECVDKDGYAVTLDVFYYPDKLDFYDSNGDPIEDLGNIDWVVDHYRIS